VRQHRLAEVDSGLTAVVNGTGNLCCVSMSLYDFFDCVPILSLKWTGKACIVAGPGVGHA
jgi:hypothetical protein